MDHITEGSSSQVMSDITNGQQPSSTNRSKSLLFESIPEDNIYSPSDNVNNENSPFPLKSSLSVRKMTGEPNSDKKVCFENSPVVVEYDKLSSEDEYSLRNSNSVDSGISSSNSSSKIATTTTNFQSTWKPNLTNSGTTTTMHSDHPKPLPPMPQTLPQSESLQQDLRFYNLNNNGQGLHNNTNNTNNNNNNNNSNNQDLSNQYSEVELYDNLDSFENGNVSEVYPPTSIAIPKLRMKKENYIKNDGELIDSDQSMEIDGKLQDLNINENRTTATTARDYTLDDLINDSNATVNRFDFNSTSSPSKRKNMSHLEDTLDSVLPPDRTPSTIIKENHNLYERYRNHNNHRIVSNSSEKYYDDVILNSVRQNVNNAFTANRDSIKRPNAVKKVSQPQEIESSKVGEEEESSKDEFTIGDYMNDSKHISGAHKSKDIFEDIEITDPTISSTQSSGKVGKPESRLSSIGSSVTPLGESTMDHSGFYASFNPPITPSFNKIDEEEDLSGNGIPMDDPQEEEEEVSEDQIMQEQQEEPSQNQIDDSFERLRNQDISIKQDDQEAFKPFSESVFIESNKDANTTPNDDSRVNEVSNDSTASNFTLKLMQLKKEKEQQQQSVNSSFMPGLDPKNTSSQTVADDSHRSLAPTRLTNSVLDTLLSKTNEYATKSGIAMTTKGVSNSGATSKTTKIFSNKHDFDKPNKPVFDKPSFPRSPTQDSLSSSEDVLNIWANMKHKESENNNNHQHQKASTIRSQSMKSSPSMNSVEIKKMLKTKRKISLRSGTGSKKYQNHQNQNHNNDNNNNNIDDSITTDRNGRVGGNFINDTIDRGNSDGEDIDDDEEEDDDNEDVEIMGPEDDDEEEDGMLDHIKDELSKIPQPLLPEQHFGNADFEQEFTQELSRFEDLQDDEEQVVRGYTTRISKNELIVAKLDEKMIDGPEEYGKQKIPNEIFNSKKPHIYQGIVSKPQQREIKVSNGSQSARSRKTSGGSGATSNYVSARNSFGKEINVRKRKSGALKELQQQQQQQQKVGDRVASINSDDRQQQQQQPFRFSSTSGSIYERQITAPKLHRISASSKRGQSLCGSIHDGSSISTSISGRDPKYSGHPPSSFQQPPEPILEDEQNYYDINLPKDDQGRLYVRIVGLKNLDLPAVDAHNAKFSLILDNGIHCISTPEVDLHTNTSINQEFELTVSDNLEFILTLKASYEYEGTEKLIEITEKYPVRKRVLGGLLGHKTIYKTRKRLVSKIDKTDPWDTKMAKDGSFARAYVDFAQYEPLITGKACNFDVTCFNEWETYEERNHQVKKRQPYRIGKLELQMLYIPRSKINEVFPPSIHIAYEAVKEYQKQLQVNYEGFLSQEGGDCNYLKRRWFTLNGTDLIAHNEFSKKTRAKINLIKAVGLISSNIKKNYIAGTTSNNNSKNNRRLSEEIIMHQGFKIKFMNGETIEFVADSQYEKMNWLRLLDSVISKNKFRQPWIKILYDQLV
ncbi:Bud4 protein [Saccharomycopsis crataegensis]|uniref:Bud4 protein n=1 Tax=Saccharomycopsis crataegensis TaxID=43959 RepID=A0AAV5QHQ8_9ASCO|nr:Bud4 protein [Saccharomycopsis crataegensis]